MSGGLATEYVLHLVKLLPAPRSTSRRFVKFCIVGAIGTGVNLSILYTLVEFFHMWYIPAEVIAILGATLSNFTGNSIWVFRAQERRAHRLATNGQGK